MSENWGYGFPETASSHLSLAPPASVGGSRTGAADPEGGVEDMNQSRSLGEIGKELVAQTLPLVSSRDEACHVEEPDRNLSEPVRALRVLGLAVHFQELAGAFHGDVADTHVGLYGGEGIVGNIYLGLRHGLEKGGFSGIRDPHYTH